MSATGNRMGIGPIQIGVILLALATAGIHLYLFLVEGFLGSGTMLPFYQILFVGNPLAYTTLAVALYFIPPLARFRPIVRTLLIAMAVSSIVSYFYVNVIDALGNIDKTIEVLLIVLATIDAGMSSGDAGTPSEARG